MKRYLIPIILLISIASIVALIPHSSIPESATVAEIHTLSPIERSYFDKANTNSQVIIGDSMGDRLPWISWTKLAWGSHAIPDILHNIQTKKPIPQTVKTIVVWVGSAEAIWLQRISEINNEAALQSFLQVNTLSRSTYEAIKRTPHYDGSVDAQVKILMYHYESLFAYLASETKGKQVRKILIGPFPGGNLNVVKTVNNQLPQLAKEWAFEFYPLYQYFHNEDGTELFDPNCRYKEDGLHLEPIAGVIVYDMIFNTSLSVKIFKKPSLALVKYKSHPFNDYSSPDLKLFLSHKDNLSSVYGRRIFHGQPWSVPIGCILGSGKS